MASTLAVAKVGSKTTVSVVGARVWTSWP